MNSYELAGIVFALTLAAAFVLYIGFIWRINAIQKAEDEAQRRYKEEIERARVARAEARAARERLSQPSPKVTSVSTELIARKYNATTPTRSATTRTTTVVHDDGNDLLTAMILQNAMNSNSDTTSGTVSWDNNVPKVHYSNTDNPIDFPAPEPARESYSSSSSSDDSSSSRSSYSSSYSSSSSDSSYSSSSSSSDYSSSSSDSGSSFSSD